TELEPERRLRNLARTIQALCDHDADASLGAVHLKHDIAYPLSHSISTSILCELVARRIGWPPVRRLSIVAAALSCNVAMMELQAELVEQAGPLDDRQWDAIQNHPLRGYEMLSAAGVGDPLWLRLVIQHHECINGLGYPSGVRGDDVLPEARLLGLADRYHAMVAGRAYREGLLAKSALRRVFLDVGQDLGSTLAQMFIKELGIYPPGSVVRLENGESAVVIRRKGELAGPMLACFANGKGEYYASPLHRDASEQERYAIRDVQPLTGGLPFGMSSLWGY
ncbi:MAG TPA: HD domain-containing protein, partial [Gammaproteobacteria bacterium]|nr:HD domain-containing protein [Gammaproteobacteria bacterium]